jgi:excisionase family DNA binding protein
MLASMKLLTEKEAAELAQVSVKTIRRLIEKKRLKAEDFGTGSKHMYRIDPTALTSMNREPETQPAQVIPIPRPLRRRPNRAAASYFPRVPEGTKPFCSP